MHSGGIIGIAFSREGDLVASIGMNRLFDIQIADWKKATILGYKNTGCDFLLTININPLDHFEIAAAGKNVLHIYRLKGTVIEQSEKLAITSLNQSDFTVTCLEYLCYSIGKRRIRDILIANNKGELGIICNSVFSVVAGKAHEGMINCLLTWQSSSSKVAVIEHRPSAS
jgi:hypothetical protein